MNYFYIDNKKINYDLENKISNSISLLDYLESIGITIPHYCYDRRLSISGNCRMCLIELKGSPKPLVACATNAKSCLNMGSELYTNSPLVKKARETVLEFLSYLIATISKGPLITVIRGPCHSLHHC